MKISHWLFSLIFLSFPILGYAQITSSTNINGYYINLGFDTWKIYSQGNDTYLEHFRMGLDSNEIFRVTGRSLSDGNLILTLTGTPKPGNPNPGRNARVILSKKDNDFYLDSERYTTRNEVNGRVIWDTELRIYNEFRRENIVYDESMFKKMQRISSQSGSYYYAGALYVIYPRYPEIEIAKIDLDDNFIVQNIDIGRITYENGSLYMHLSNTIQPIEDNFMFRMGSLGLYQRFGNSPRLRTRNIIYPEFGTSLIKSKQVFDSITVIRNDYSVDDIIERYTGSFIITIDDQNNRDETYYVIKNGYLINYFPTAGETLLARVTERNSDITIIDYSDNSRSDWNKKINLEIKYKRE